MKNGTIKLIILFSALSLVGLILTQALLIKNAVDLAQMHFEHRANVALHSAVVELKRSRDTCCFNNSCKVKNDIVHIVKPHLLDSLIRKYSNHNKLFNNYEFAIVDSHTDSIYYQTKGYYRDCPSEKVFKHCLSCFNLKGSFHIELIYPESLRSLMTDMWKWLILEGIFILIIVFCFGFIIFAVFRHKKVSEMKTDFINNMTHEFKTPLSTISLASEVLLSVNKEITYEKITRYARIIFEENQRMQSQVEQVLRMAKLDRGEYEVQKEETDLHELIQNAVHNLCLEHSDKEVKITYNLKAENHVLMADQIHITNIVKNLVENAYKYSNKMPEIEISTHNLDNGVAISVKDNGIGIASDKLKYIFDKFYRVPTGNVHDVKGFGIGLYYVKIMTEAHAGKVSVKSTLGVGSKFDVFLPFQ